MLCLGSCSCLLKCVLSLRQVVSVQAEMEQLWNPLNMSAQVISKLQGDLRQMQFDRQRDIWAQIVCFSRDNFSVGNMLKRRKESGAYLATDCRHRWSLKMMMKNDN